ncbi:hypothetical protein HYQ46_001593 [Verticillium longisporum]|nr:hypothetical protein HYQ44_006776 [Verticillium longisporum]KAG7149497.1 hypothetical protein HYQ46_001593 [Verticillium longisporum]
MLAASVRVPVYLLGLTVWRPYSRSSLLVAPSIAQVNIVFHLLRGLFSASSINSSAHTKQSDEPRPFPY